MKISHVIIIVVLIILLGAGAAAASAYANNKDAEKKNAPELDANGKATTTPAAAKPLDYNRSLFVGVKGEEVKEFQRLYNASKFSTTDLLVDGIFGAKSLSAMRSVMGIVRISTTLTDFKAKLNGESLVATTTTTAPAKSWYDFFLHSMG